MNTLAFVLAFFSATLIPLTLGGLLAWGAIATRRILLQDAQTNTEKYLLDGAIAIVAGFLLLGIALYSHDWAVSGAKTFVWYMHTH